MIKRIVRIIKSFNFKRKTANKNTPKILGKIILENKNILIGKNVVIYNNVKFWGNGKIVLGDNVKVGDNVMIYASEGAGVTIGKDTLIAANCYIIDMDHGIKKDTLISEQPSNAQEIIIGEDCWLGEDVTVLKGSVLGNGCIVGAKSLVNKAFDANKIIVGIPARIIKERT